MTDRSYAVVALAMIIALTQFGDALKMRRALSLHNTVALEFNGPREPAMQSLTPAPTYVNSYLYGDWSIETVIRQCEARHGWEMIYRLFSPDNSPRSATMRKTIFSSVLDVIKTTDELRRFRMIPSLVHDLNRLYKQAILDDEASAKLELVPGHEEPKPSCPELIDIALDITRREQELSPASVALLHLIVLEYQSWLPNMIHVLCRRYAPDASSRVRYVSVMVSRIPPGFFQNDIRHFLQGFVTDLGLRDRAEVALATAHAICSQTLLDDPIGHRLTSLYILLWTVHGAVRSSSELAILKEDPVAALAEPEPKPESDPPLDTIDHFIEAMENILRSLTLALSPDRNLSSVVRRHYLLAFMLVIRFAMTPEHENLASFTNVCWTEVVWNLVQYAPECFRPAGHVPDCYEKAPLCVFRGCIPTVLFLKLLYCYLKPCPLTDNICEKLLDMKDVDLKLLQGVALRTTPALFRRLFSTRSFAEWSTAYKFVLSRDARSISSDDRHFSLMLPCKRMLTELEATNLRHLAVYLGVSIKRVLSICDLRMPPPPTGLSGSSLHP